MQAAFSATFLLSYLWADSPISFFIRLVTGLPAILLIPGVLLTDLVLPEKVKSLATTLVLGIGLLLLEIQALFTISLFTSIVIPLFLWVIPLNGFFVVTLCGLFRRRKRVSVFDYLFRADRGLLAIMFLAVVLRVCLAWLAQGSIGPDASLYSDYAREIMNGTFQSSILNDGAVAHLTSTVDYVAHHAFTYVTAISGLLLSPLTSGPALILVVEGVALVEIVYSIAAVHFSRTTARMVAVLVAMQPLFLFHSAVGYGPEITALLFLLAAYYVLPDRTSETGLGFITSGILIGLVDVIWYTDFYAACACLPLLLRFTKGASIYDTIVFSLMIGLTFIGRLFFTSALLFYSSFAGAVLVYEAARFLKPSTNLQRFLPFFGAIFMVVAFWRWPLQVSASTSGILSIPTPANPLVSALLSPLSPSLLVQFLEFLLFHLTPALFVLVVLALLFGKNRTIVLASVLTASLVSVGTLKAFSLMPGSLEYQYLFSDSRFFLLIVASLILCIGGFFDKYSSSEEPSEAKETAWPHVRTWKPVLLIAIVTVGFMVEYPLMQTGLDLVNIRERYGWADIESKSGLLGNDSTVFLVDRAREFAWITGRKSATLWLSAPDLNFPRAGEEIAALASRFNTQYLVVDNYTSTHWRVMENLYRDEIPAGHPILLNMSCLKGLDGNSTGPVSVLTLIAATEPNNLGRYARIFRFDAIEFDRSWTADMLDPAWEVSNEGSLVEIDGKTHLVIGPGYNYTNTWRPNDDDLNVTVQMGFLLCDLEEVNATVTRVEVYSSSGTLISLAEKIDSSHYYLPLSGTTVGNIAIVIEGESGESVIIRSVSIWEAQIG